MERCEVQYRARRSFEKAHGDAPPRLQVIGFKVSSKAEAAAAKGGLEIVGASYHELDSLNEAKSNSSPSTLLPKPASSPRSALQQLLLHQSPAPAPSTSTSTSTSSPFSNHSLPPLLPPSSSATQTFPPAPLSSHKPGASSSPSSNQNFTSPPAANQKSPPSGLLQPATSPPSANQNCTSGFSKSQSPSASPYQSNSSTGTLKSLLDQSPYVSSDIPANRSSGRTSFFSSLGQSQCASSSSSSGNQSMISVNMQMINQHSSKPSKTLIMDNYQAFFQIKQTGDDKNKEFNNGIDAKAHGIGAKEVISEFPYIVAESQRSSWLHDDIEHPYSAEKCKRSSRKQIHEHPLGNEKSRKSSWNEEKSKKSSLFMFMVASSPAAEFHHHHHHHAEHNTSKNMDFLSCCHLCRRHLGQGQDVFMYSGDKAFCSMECRYQQIVMDERKERCPPPIIRSGASQVYPHSSVTATTTHHPIMINKPHFINTAAAA